VQDVRVCRRIGLARERLRRAELSMEENLGKIAIMGCPGLRLRIIDAGAAR
jgi:hypothetical protein